MAAAVVPLEHSFRRPLRAEHAQNALQIGRLARVVLTVIGHAVEEARRRKLLAVAHDHRLPAPDDRSQRLDRTHLARLVEHDQVEDDRPRRDILGDRQRAHHEYRLDALDRAPRLCHQPPDRQVTTLLLELPPEHAKLAASVLTRKLLPVALGDQRPVVVELRHVQLTEPLHDARVRGAVELGERGAFPKGQVQPGGVACVVEEWRQLPASVLPRRRGLGHLRNPRPSGLPFELVEAHHLVSRCDLVVGIPQPRFQVVPGALLQRLAGLDPIGPQLHGGGERTQRVADRFHSALAHVGGGFQVGAPGRVVEQRVDVRVDQPAGPVAVKAQEPLHGVGKAPVRVHAVAQRERGEKLRHEVVRFCDRSAQPAGFQDRVNELDLFGDSVGRLPAAEPPHPTARIAERPREEAPPLVAVSTQRLARVQHVLVPRFGHEDAVVARPDVAVAAGCRGNLRDALGVGRPTGMAVIRPQQCRSFRHPSRSAGRPFEIVALQTPKHHVAAKHGAERVGLAVENADGGGRIRDEFADPVRVGGHEVETAARPPEMPARDADRRDQFLHFADQRAAAGEVLGVPRCRAADLEPPALDLQPVGVERGEAANQLVRGQVALGDR